MTFVAVRAIVSVTEKGTIEPVVPAAADPYQVYIRLKDGSAVMAVCRDRIYRTFREGATLEIRPSVTGGWRVFRPLSTTGVKHSKSGVFRQIRSSNNTIKLEEASGLVAFRLGSDAWFSPDQVKLEASPKKPRGLSLF